MSENLKDIIAFVGVRSGSQRVLNKNIRPFGDTTLLDLKLKTLKKVKGLRSIVVSSDCPQMLDIASKYDVQLHERDSYYASAKCSQSEYFSKITEMVDADNIMYCPVTSPFVTSKTYDRCIDLFQTHSNVVTTNLVKCHMWLNGKPINYDVTNAPNSQDLPDIHEINFGCCLISKMDLQKNKNFVSANPLFVPIDERESVDIDTEIEFNFAEYLYNKG